MLCEQTAQVFDISRWVRGAYADASTVAGFLGAHDVVPPPQRERRGAGGASAQPSAHLDEETSSPLKEGRGMLNTERKLQPSTERFRENLPVVSVRSMSVSLVQRDEQLLVKATTETSA